LAKSGVLVLQDEHAARVLKNLLALKTELLTFPYDEL
jgi:hypothetical protein